MPSIILSVFTLLCSVQLAHSQSFNLYPDGLDPVKLSSALNISTDCLAALNETIDQCDQTLFQMASNFDDYWWEDANVTALCSGNCSLNAAAWRDDLVDPCYQEYVTAYGRAIPASSVAQRYIDGVNLVCLPSDEYHEHPWCLTNSQEWVGSDFVRADCSVNPSDPTCGGNSSAIPSENTRMANLYNDTILQDIQDVCSTQLPEVTIRNLPPYESATIALPTTSTGTAPPASTTCAGQTVSSGSDCNTLSNTYGVATGDLQALSGNATCQITSAVCLPAACVLQTVGSGQTCDTVATSMNITTVQLLSWNRNIMGLCDSLTPGQYICGSAPGTNKTFTLPPPPLGTDADAGNQQRGGIGGIVTPTTTATSIGNSVSGGLLPSPTQDGLADSCNNFASAKPNDNCIDFAKSHSIAATQLYAWNPVLGLNGVNCSTKLWASEYYCVGVAPATIVTAPGPTQSGIIAGCNKYAQAISGDGCDVFASRNLISSPQLFAWNSVLGSTGQNCGTQLQAQEWYCVGISAGGGAVITTTGSSPTTTVNTPPGPTQSGIVSSCNKYALAISGDGCDAFASRNGITDAQLYAWNPVLGSSGQNCANSLWAKEAYCVGVSGSAATTTKPSSTPTTTAVTAPGPTQTGIAANCNMFAITIDGEGCDAFATRNKITDAQLYAWNTVLGTDGQNCASSFWAKEYYCVGVSS